MNALLKFMPVLLLFGGMLPAFAQDEGDNEATKLDSYSVGDRRAPIEQEKIEIERPKFNFKVDAAKPSLGSMQLAKPNLEIVTPPQPQAGTDASAADTPRTSSTGGASSSAGAVPGTQGETRSVVPLRMDPPNYPREAYRRRQEGQVVVEFTINAEGGTEDVTVVEATPRGVFDSEARRAVARWTFQPALRDGRPVPQRIRHTLEFKLN